MNAFKIFSSFLLGMFSLFITGNMIWAEEDHKGEHYKHHKSVKNKSMKVKKKIKSASIALNEFTCAKDCKVKSAKKFKMKSNKRKGSNKKHHGSNKYKKHEHSNKKDKDKKGSNKNACSNKSMKSYSVSDNDGITTDRSWRKGSYNHRYTSNKPHKVLICRDVNPNENYNFGDGNDIVVVKGNLGGGNNFNLGGGDDIIAISGAINGNVAIDGGNGTDVIMLVNGLNNYNFKNFTNNNGIISAQITDNATGQTITINNMDGFGFTNGTSILPVSNTNNVSSLGSGISNIKRVSTNFANGIKNVQIVKQNGNVYVQYNGKLYDAVVFNNGIAIIGNKSIGLLWKEN